jgi:hypothetical protein
MAKNALHWLAVRGMRAMVSYKPWLPLWQQFAPNTGEQDSTTDSAAVCCLIARVLV